MQSSLEKKEKNKSLKKEKIIVITSIILMMCGLVLLGFKNYQSFIKDKIDEEKLDDFFDEYQEDINISVENEDIDIKKETISKSQSSNNYMAVLEIPKINLKRGIYPKESKENTVKKNIELLSDSNMPDKENGNFILAGHNGTSKVSYFNKLGQLKKGDIAYIYYNGLKYSYELINSYEVKKTGEVEIIRDKEKTTLTLITCKHNFEIQMIYIFELIENNI